MPTLNSGRIFHNKYEKPPRGHTGRHGYCKQIESTVMERKMMKIRVEIAEKPYRLTIPADEEERVRRAAKHIRDQIENLKRNYDASLTEYLAMAAMRISIENEENKERLKMAPEALRLKDLATTLDRWISSNSDQDGEDFSAATAQPPAKPKARRGRPRKRTTEDSGSSEESETL